MSLLPCGQASAQLRWVVLAAFFLSGLSALVYQVVWMRMLTQVFGATVFAVATVITVFMAGLALGSYVFGRWADHPYFSTKLLMIYALMEGVIGLYCLLTPWFFNHIDSLYGYIYGLADINFYLFSLIRFFFSLVILFVPTFLMGATLPVLGRFLVAHQNVIGRRVGALYGLNTFGAVVGVLLASFVLIPGYGVNVTLWVAVAVNFVIAVGMYFSGRLVMAGVDGAVKEKESQRLQGQQVLTSSQARVVFVVFALSGFAALGYEVVWFRILSLTIGNSVYAFAVMLATFLFGLALGSYIFGWYVDRIKNYFMAFAVIEILIGIFALGLVPLFGSLPVMFLGLSQYFDYGFWSYQVVNFITAFIVIIIPTILMGAVFPLVVRMLTRGVSVVGRNVGSLYAANTAGGVFGSFVVGFVFIPLLGLQSSLVWIAGLNIFLGCVLVAAMTAGGRGLKAVVVCLGVLIVAVGGQWLPAWDRYLMTSAVYYNAGFYYNEFRQGRLAAALKDGRNIVYYNEGVTGTVSVVENPGNLSLAVNGKVTADIKNNSSFNVMLGSLPLLLHSDPSEALLVGLGSGVTLGAMERFPLENITAVELSPEVVEANRLFSSYNNNALRDDRLAVVVNDARSYIAYEDASYDVIVSAPSFPLMAGVGNLFTQEFYRAAKSKLKPGGIMAQWLNTYALKADDMRLLMRTFRSVFPHATLWGFESGDFILLGTDRGLDLDYGRVSERMADRPIKKMLRRIGVDSPEELAAGLTLGEEALGRFVGRGEVNTYDSPRIEFAIPRSIYLSTEVSNYNNIVHFNPVSELDVVVPALAGETNLSFMGLVARMGAAWSNAKLIYRINNIAVPDQVGGRSFYVKKDVAAVAVWTKGLAGHEGYQRLRLRMIAGSGRRSVDGSRQLLQASLKAPSVSQGVTVVGGYRVYWALDQVAATAQLSFSWYCPGNEHSYIADLELSVGSLARSPEESVRSIVSKYECIAA